MDASSRAITQQILIGLDSILYTLKKIPEDTYTAYTTGFPDSLSESMAWLIRIFEHFLFWVPKTGAMDSDEIAKELKEYEQVHDWMNIQTVSRIEAIARINTIKTNLDTFSRNLTEDFLKRKALHPPYLTDGTIADAYVEELLHSLWHINSRILRDFKEYA